MCTYSHFFKVSFPFFEGFQKHFKILVVNNSNQDIFLRRKHYNRPSRIHLISCTTFSDNQIFQTIRYIYTNMDQHK